MGHRWRINDGIAVALLAIVAIAPLPLGSNRPMFWMLSAAGVFAVAGVFFLGIAHKNRKLPVPMRAVWMPIALVAAALIFMILQSTGVLSSVAPKASFLATLRGFSYAMFFFLVLQVAANCKRANAMVEALFYTVLFYALIGFLTRFSGVQLPEILGLLDVQTGATATFVNRNSFATYLGFGLLTGLALIIRRIGSRGGAKIGLATFADIRLAIYFVVVLVIFVTLIATGSRMGVAAVLFALGIALLILTAKTRKLGWPVAGITAVAMGAAFYLYGTDLLDRLGSVERDIDVRLALYQQVWDMIMARPWAGFGADSFDIAFQKFHKLPVSPDLIWDKAHNSYLTNWAEAGLVFGSIPILLLALALWKFGRVIASRPRDFVLPLLGLAVIAQSTLHSLVDFSLEIQANTYLLLAIVAIALADALKAR